MDFQSLCLFVTEVCVLFLPFIYAIYVILRQLCEWMLKLFHCSVEISVVPVPDWSGTEPGLRASGGCVAAVQLSDQDTGLGAHFSFLSHS